MYDTNFKAKVYITQYKHVKMYSPRPILAFLNTYLEFFKFKRVRRPNTAFTVARVQRKSRSTHHRGGPHAHVCDYLFLSHQLVSRSVPLPFSHLVFLSPQQTPGSSWEPPPRGASGTAAGSAPPGRGATAGSPGRAPRVPAAAGSLGRALWAGVASFARDAGAAAARQGGDGVARRGGSGGAVRPAAWRRRHNFFPFFFFFLDAKKFYKTFSPIFLLLMEKFYKIFLPEFFLILDAKVVSSKKFLFQFFLIKIFTSSSPDFFLKKFSKQIYQKMTRKKNIRWSPAGRGFPLIGNRPEATKLTGARKLDSPVHRGSGREDRFVKLWLEAGG